MVTIAGFAEGRLSVAIPDGIAAAPPCLRFWPGARVATETGARVVPEVTRRIYCFFTLNAPTVPDGRPPTI